MGTVQVTVGRAHRHAGAGRSQQAGMGAATRGAVDLHLAGSGRAAVY